MTTKTAFITGASSGIGLSLAKEFAKKNYNLVLVARNEIQLKKIKQEFEKNYSIKVLTIICDLSQVIHSLDTIKKTLSDTSIDVLVNNAGFGIHGDFNETDLHKEIDMVNLQTSCILSLTKLFLPKMIEKKSGAILNVGSVYSYLPVPYQAVYGACKAFILSFSTSLAHEVKDKGIKVTTLCPGTTKTQFRKQFKESSPEKFLKGLSPDIVATQAIEALQRGDLVCVPGATNKFFVNAASFVPSKLMSKLVTYVNYKRGLN